MDNSKKRLALFLMGLLIGLLVAVPSSARSNPYNLFGNGNCAYLAWEIADIYYPASFHVPGSYDAIDWARLAGKTAEADGVEYELVIADEPQAGDFMIYSPYFRSSKRGHIAFVCGVTERTDINLVKREVIRETYLEVLESTDYASDLYYNFKHKNCLFRYHKILYKSGDDYMHEPGQIRFLRLVKVGDMSDNQHYR